MRREPLNKDMTLQQVAENAARAYLARGEVRGVFQMAVEAEGRKLVISCAVRVDEYGEWPEMLPGGSGMTKQ